MAGLHFEITGGNEDLIRKLAESRRAILDSSKTAEQQGAKIEGMFKRMASGAAIFGVGFSSSQFVKDMINVRGEFQKTQMAFETMLGSKEKADMLMAQMVQTAAKTPFDLQGVANGAKQLLAYGTAAEDVNDTLVRLGNIASGLSIPLGDMVYLYGTTQTQGRLFTQDVRQFMGRGIPLVKELALMLGKTEEEINKMVTAGKIGFPEVEKVIKKMTDEGGKFYNLMEKQSETISGQISNLGDAWDGMLNSIGEDTQGLSSATISMATDVVENYEKVGRILMSLIAVYGTYKAAVVVTNFVLKEQAAMNAILVASNGALSSSTVLQIHLSSKLEKAQKLLNATMLKNPYVAVAALVVGLASGVWALSNSTTAAEKAQKHLNDAAEESEKAALSEQRELAKLKGELAATTKGTEEYNRIKDEIVSKYGKYDKNLKDEIDKVGLLDTTYQNLTKSIQQSFDVRQYEKFKQEQGSSLDEVMSNNLGKIQDRLYKDLGDEEGSRVYTKIRLAILEGKELDNDIKSTLDKVQDKGTVLADSRIDSYIKNIKDAQKATDEFDQKARVKFGINGKEGKVDGKEGEKKELSSVSEEIKTVTSNISTLKQELSDLRSGKTTAEAGKTIQSAIEEKAKDLKAAEDSLATLTGTTKKEGISANTLQSEQSDRLRAIEDYRKSISEAGVQAELDIRQQGIEALDEGSKKELAMIHLNYDRLMDANRKRANEMIKERQELERKQWEYDNPKWKDKGMTFKPTTTKVDQLPESQQNQLLAYDDLADTQRRKATKDHLDKERQAMDEYLKEYGTHMEKRQAITDLYNEKMAKAKTEGERLTLGKEMTKALSDLDMAANKTTSAISRLFGDMSDKTVADMRIIADEGKKALEFLKNGRWDATTGARLGMSEETFNTLKDSPEELEAAAKGIKGIRDEADQMDTSFNKISGGLKKVFSAGDDSKKLKEGLEEISEGMNEVMQAAQFLSDTFSQLGDAFGNDTLKGVAEGLNVAMDAMDSAMRGAKAGAMFGPVGAAAGAAVGAVTSLISSFAKIHDAKNERRIQRLQDQIDVLDKSYEKLGDSIEKAYSKDASNLIDQQNKMLEQQKVLIQNQIMEEEAKKKTDDDRIQEWKDQLDEITDTIADNEEAAKDAIFGEDLKSAIDNFAGAYADAWASGEDRAKSAKDTVKNMMRQMVTESIKAAVESSGAMERIRTKLEEFYADNVLTGWEQDYIYKMAEGLQKEIDSKYGWADGLMRDEDKEDATREASAKGIASMSQESADQLNGQFNTQLIYLDKTLVEVTGIREQMRLIYGLQVKGWKDVEAIRELSGKVSENTGRVAEISGRIEELSGKIETNTRSAARGIQDMNDKGLILRSY